MEDPDELRRRDDILLGKLLGAFEAFKEESIEWRKERDRKDDAFEKKMDERLKPLETFFGELRTPRIAVLYLLRAVGVSVVGAISWVVTHFVMKYVNAHWK